jgi:hypothetical protein
VWFVRAKYALFAVDEIQTHNLLPRMYLPYQLTYTTVVIWRDAFLFFEVILESLVLLPSSTKILYRMVLPNSTNVDL